MRGKEGSVLIAPSLTLVLGNTPKKLAQIKPAWHLNSECSFPLPTSIPYWAINLISRERNKAWSSAAGARPLRHMQLWPGNAYRPLPRPPRCQKNERKTSDFLPVSSPLHSVMPALLCLSPWYDNIHLKPRTVCKYHWTIYLNG